MTSFVNLKNFQSLCQKCNFPSLLAPQRNVSGLEQELFLCGYFVLCQFVFMWFGDEVGPGLIPSQTILQISLCFRAIKPKEGGLGSASWKNPSGFTPCHCVCIWTVPAQPPPPFHFIWNIRPTWIWTPKLCFFETQPSSVETRCPRLLSAVIWWDSTAVFNT